MVRHTFTYDINKMAYFLLCILDNVNIYVKFTVHSFSLKGKCNVKKQ